jgi:hypothetical protein
VWEFKVFSLGFQALLASLNISLGMKNKIKNVYILVCIASYTVPALFRGKE